MLGCPQIWPNCIQITLSRGFPCDSACKESACSVGDLGLIPGLGRSPGAGKGYSLQDSGLDSPGDAKSWARLSDFHFTILSRSFWRSSWCKRKTNPSLSPRGTGNKFPLRNVHPLHLKVKGHPYCWRQIIEQRSLCKQTVILYKFTTTSPKFI